MLMYGVLSATGCARAGMEMRQVSQPDFWGALAELRPDAAARFARTPSQRLFAQSLDRMMAGEMPEAESGFSELSKKAEDSLLRTGARVAYSAVLQFEEKSDVLASLPPSDPRAANPADLAGVEAWAASFKAVAPKLFEFPGRTVILPLLLSPAGTPMIPVRIKGHDYHFWLDSGSSMTIVASDVTAALGQIVVHNATAMIVNDRQMEMRETRPVTEASKIDGIIGFDIIHRLDVGIDSPKSRVRLRDPSLRMKEVRASRNLFWLGVPVVRLIASDGTPLHCGLDTGAQQTFGTETLFDKLQITGDRREPRQVEGLAGVASLQAAIVHRLDLSVRDQPLYLRELVIYASVYRTLVSLDGVLGSDVLRLGVVRLDATNGVFSVNEGIRPVQQ
jgi:hypothetical protein